MLHIRWQFTEHQNDVGPFWTWTRFHLDGRAQRQSKKFPNYAKAVYDAIRNEFKPRSENWSVTVSSGTTSYFNAEPIVQNGPLDRRSYPRANQPPPGAQSPPLNQPKTEER